MGLILRSALASVQEQYDVVLIGLSSCSGCHMVNALAASSRVLVPVQTEFLALKGLERMVKTFEMMQGTANKHLITSSFRPCLISVHELLCRLWRRSRRCMVLESGIR